MTILEKRPLAWFKTESQVRKHFDEEALRQLGESLMKKQLQPILANSDGMILVGERRFRAACLLKLKELDVIISDKPMTESEVRIFQLTENIQRVDLSDGEKWQAFLELLRINPKWTNKDLAQHLKLSEGTIAKYLSLSRCIKEVQDAFEAGQIGITSCYAISSVPAEQQAELLLKAASTSRDGLAEHIRKQRKASTPQVRTKKISCPLPSGVSITASGQDLSLDDFIEALGEAQKEARKAREQGLDARTFAAVMKDKSRKQ